jgi:hypothetical protein
MLVCHHCDTPACVNPAHFFLGTHDDNMRDMAVKGRAGRGAFWSGDANPSRLYPEKYRGEAHPRAKLTESTVREIRVRYASGGTTLRALAAEYGVSFGQIGYVVNRRTWKHVA